MARVGSLFSDAVPRDRIVTPVHQSGKQALGVLLVLVMPLIGATSACGGSADTTSPTQPSPSSAPFDPNGTWTGTASDSTGPGQMTWQVTASGASFSGMLTMTDTTANVTGRGTVSGTVSGSSITFLLAIPAGGFGGSYASCTANASGTAEGASSTITGTYAGSNSCTGAFGSGQFTLNKQ